MTVSRRHALWSATALLVLGAAFTPVSSALSSDEAPDCGTTILTAAGDPRTCTFSDDFTGDELDASTWDVQETATSGYHNGGDCFVADDKNVSVADGVLSLTTRDEGAPFTCASPEGDYASRHTSGMVTSVASFAQTYGRFEIRAKFPASSVPGLHSALWLWPRDPSPYGAWPASGEIDIAEAYSQWPDRAIPFLHYASRTADPTVTNNYCMIDDLSAFHTYAVEWTATTITILYDGAVCLDHVIDPAAPLTGSAPFDNPYFIALTQSLGLGENAVTPETPLPATMQIDYVRVWK